MKNRYSNNMDDLTILGSLKKLIEIEPHKELYRFLEQNGNVHTITPTSLDLRSKIIASELQLYDSYQKPVIILYNAGYEYIYGVFACLYAGAIAVPAYPPVNEEMGATLKKIIENSESCLILTNKQIESSLKKSKFFNSLISIERHNLHSNVVNVSWQLNQLRLINTSEITDSGEHYIYPPSALEDVAYIQYTSGSTKQPKGVVITHGNLIANLRQLKQATQLTSEDVSVSWLPPYHDLGLVTGIFLPLFLQCKAVLFSPISFLQDPSLWLRVISQYKGTFSGGPDFSFKIVLNKVCAKQLEGINLSSWRLAFCGAESIDPDTFPSFYNKFSNYGLEEHIFSPSYGLAESVVYVSFLKPQEKPYYQLFEKQTLLEKNIAVLATNDAEVQKIVSVGFTPNDSHVRIVNPESCEPLNDGHIGEIWYYGPNAARSYWNNPIESAQQLNAQLFSDESNAYRYIRTGDLGFIFNQQLFITGRIKDLIIINGLNHYSHDIEGSVRSGVTEMKLGNIAAFSVKTEVSEGLVILVEVKKDLVANLSTLRQNIRELIVRKHFISPQKIFFVATKTLPKTTSGKLKRVQCREYYLNNKFKFLESD